MQILSDVPHSKTGANSSQVSAMAWNVPGEMFSRFLGLVAPKNHPQPSVDDLEAIKTLDTQLKAWQDRAKLFYVQGEPLREEAAALGVDIDCFWRPLPPGASQELRAWADESSELRELADKLQRLQTLKAQLPSSYAAGRSTKQYRRRIEANHHTLACSFSGKMFDRFPGLEAARNLPEPSVEDLEGINTLDVQIKAWRDRAKLFYMQAEPLRSEAAALGVDVNCFWRPLPPGASQQLRDWADESDKLNEQADRLKRLKALKKQLRLSHAPGSTTTIMPAACSSDTATAAVRRFDYGAVYPSLGSS